MLENREIRAEQDAAYDASLAADRARDARRAEEAATRVAQEDQERALEQAAREEREEQEVRRLRRRERLAAALVPEPPLGEGVTVMFSFPDSSGWLRRFPQDAPARALRTATASQPQAPPNFQLVTVLLGPVRVPRGGSVQEAFGTDTRRVRVTVRPANPGESDEDGDAEDDAGQVEDPPEQELASDDELFQVPDDDAIFQRPYLNPNPPEEDVPPVPPATDDAPPVAVLDPCCVCKTRRADAVNTPCMHISMCFACATDSEFMAFRRVCAICRKQIERWQRVFFTGS